MQSLLEACASVRQSSRWKGWEIPNFLRSEIAWVAYSTSLAGKIPKECISQAPFTPLGAHGVRIRQESLFPVYGSKSFAARSPAEITGEQVAGNPVTGFGFRLHTHSTLVNASKSRVWRCRVGLAQPERAEFTRWIGPSIFCGLSGRRRCLDRCPLPSLPDPP